MVSRPALRSGHRRPTSAYRIHLWRHRKIKAHSLGKGKGCRPSPRPDCVHSGGEYLAGLTSVTLAERRECRWRLGIWTRSSCYSVARAKFLERLPFPSSEVYSSPMYHKADDGIKWHAQAHSFQVRSPIQGIQRRSRTQSSIRNCHSSMAESMRILVFSS